MKLFLKKIFRKVFDSYANDKELEKWKNLVSNFKNYGTKCYIAQPYTIINPKYISLGNNFISWHNLRLEAIDNYNGQIFNPQIIIGENVIINSDCHIGCINKVSIGNDVLIAGKVYISDHSHGEISLKALDLPPADRELVSKGEVIIEDNVWIGEGVCIMPGVQIGKNSIIGANSVVTKNVPNNTVVAGIPARVIRVLS